MICFHCYSANRVSETKTSPTDDANMNDNGSESMTRSINYTHSSGMHSIVRSVHLKIHFQIVCIFCYFLSTAGNATLVPSEIPSKIRIIESFGQPNAGRVPAENQLVVQQTISPNSEPVLIESNVIQPSMQIRFNAFETIQSNEATLTATSIDTADDSDKVILLEDERSWSVEFKCVSEELADALIKKPKSDLDHLTTSAYLPCMKRTTKEKEMIGHRIVCHKHAKNLYLKVEKSGDLVVYKLVQNGFQCELCGLQFDNRNALANHNHTDHMDTYLIARIVQRIQVIESNDPNQPAKSLTETSNRLCYCAQFFCEQHQKVIGTRAKAFDHFNETHAAGEFELRLKLCLYEDKEGIINEILADFRAENRFERRIYAFECLECGKFYESMSSAEVHMKRMHQNDPLACFTIEKLVGCPKDKIISNYSRLKNHWETKHAAEIESNDELAFTPVNIFRSNVCGQCLFQCSDVEELFAHYKLMHPDGKSFTHAFIKSLQLDHISRCRFIPGCCSTTTPIMLRKIVDHVAKCKHRLHCFGCPHLTFGNIVEFISHRQIYHKDSREKLQEKLLDLKNFLALLSGMKILLPNGLILEQSTIKDSDYEMILRKELIYLVNRTMEKEQALISSG